jgi:glycerate kinase
MLSFLLAPDSLKGSLSARDACIAMETGIRRALPANVDFEVIAVPLADGGEGTVEALVTGAGGELRTLKVRGPLGQEVNAQWAILPDGSAVIEMAQSSGLTLVPAEQRNALRASTYGTGEVIQAALDAGCRRLLIGIGGSATTDGGTGALQALGLRFLDGQGNELAPGGAALAELQSIDAKTLDTRLKEVEIQVLCDVTNPLCGENGAASVYGPQKGASPSDVELLDTSLSRYADLTGQILGSDLRYEAGAGAAGGTGFGLMAWTGAKLVPGIEAVLEATGFSARLERADLVLTAEGAIDRQTPQGKALAGVAKAAGAARGGQGVPVVAFGGAVKLSGGALSEMGIVAALPLPDAPQTLNECVSRAADLLSDATERAIRLYHIIPQQ